MRTLAFLALLVAAAGAEDWRFPRGDAANTGVVKNRGPTKQPKVVWQEDEEGAIAGGAALSEGRLVYGAGEYLVACRRASGGGKIWQKKVKQQVVAWPLIAGDWVYFGGQDTVHYRVRLRDAGEPNPVEAKDAIVADPAVMGDYYLAGATDGFFYAMHAERGSLLWKREIGPVRHGAAVDRKAAYVATEAGVLHAIELRKGEARWTYDAKAPTRCAPILDRNTVYLVTTDRVEALSANKGAVEATYETRGIARAPVIDGSTLYYGTDGGEIVALDVKRNRETWRVKVAEGGVTTPLILARKALYGAAGATLFAVAEKDGRELWTHKGDSVWTPPIVADGCMYAGAGQTFYCLK